MNTFNIEGTKLGIIREKKSCKVLLNQPHKHSDIITNKKE
jgi:hypothetical protein